MHSADPWRRERNGDVDQYFPSKRAPNLFERFLLTAVWHSEDGDFARGGRRFVRSAAARRCKQGSEATPLPVESRLVACQCRLSPARLATPFTLLLPPACPWNT